MTRAGWIVSTVTLVMVLALVVCGLKAANAHDNGQYGNVSPQIRAWYNNQHNKHGGWCCDESDGEQYLGDYQLDADGSVEFDVNGVHYHLPEYMVLNDANPTGHAVWWHNSTQSYCFALGSGG